MDKLEIELICPGHGKVSDKGLLAKQKRYFVDMRSEIQKGIDGKKSLEDITASLDLPWYKEWTEKPAKENKDNVKHVYDELMGKIDHERLGTVPAPLDYVERRTRVADLPTILQPKAE